MEHNNLIYQSSEGALKLNVRFKDKTVWLTTKQMSIIFGCSVDNICLHLKNIFNSTELDKNSVSEKISATATDGKNYQTQIYNLDAIISVGYRVNSKEASKFRQWATKILIEYITKGVVLDDDRLKNDKNTDIEELVQRIRDIRASEKNFYQKVRDLLKLSNDYNANEEETKNFFATIQNKLLFAIVNKTAAEIIFERANHKEINMGLTSYRGSIVRKEDIYISKNYLTEQELSKLNRLITMFLDYVENQVEKTQQPLYMKDWQQNTDAFLQFNKYLLIDNKGKKSNKQAKDKAEIEYDIFDKIRKKYDKIEADKEDERELKKLKELIINDTTYN